MNFLIGLVLFAASLFAAPIAQAACTPNGPGNWNAADITLAEINNCITVSSPGDSIFVPPGTASWSGGVALNGRHLIGATSPIIFPAVPQTGTNTAPPAPATPTNLPDRVVTAGLVTITKHATQITELAGFRFTGNDWHYDVQGAASSQPFIIRNNEFNGSGSACGTNVCNGRIQVNGGIVQGNWYHQSPPSANDIFTITGGETWSTTFTEGTLDIGGTHNIYFEDNRYDSYTAIAGDCDSGARVVWRHNTFIDSGMTSHGGGNNTSGNDTSIEGCRSHEVYDNHFIRISNLVGVDKWYWLRGSTGVFIDNTVDRTDSPNPSQFGGNKDLIRMGVGCDQVGAVYPLQYQVGQSQVTATTPPPNPVLIYGNSGYGTTAVNFIAVTENATNNAHHCPDPQNWIVLGRDYQTSNTWGYVKFTYPHPLLGGGSPPPPPPVSFFYPTDGGGMNIVLRYAIIVVGLSVLCFGGLRGRNHPTIPLISFRNIGVIETVARHDTQPAQYVEKDKSDISPDTRSG